MPSLRDRLLDAAQHLVDTEGWTRVTMARVAALVGVSRQTVHNELGTRHALARDLALRELERFLDVVRTRMAAEPDLVGGVRAACEGCLVLAENSPLVRTIVTSVAHDQDGDLLTILTTESGEIVETAGAVVKASVLEHPDTVPLDDAELDVAVEAVVRLVLSCITRPSKPPAEAARDIAWILELAIRGTQA